MLGALLAAGAIGFGLFVAGGALRVAFGPRAPDAGDVAPAYRVTALDGAAAESTDYAGRVVLLDFWATTCVGCIGSTPRLNRLHAEYAPRGFSVVSMNQEPEDLDRVREVVRERAIAYPVLVDPGGVADAYGVAALPTVVLIDRTGRIRARYVGPVAETRLREEIEALIRES